MSLLVRLWKVDSPPQTNNGLPGVEDVLSELFEQWSREILGKQICFLFSSRNVNWLDVFHSVVVPDKMDVHFNVLVPFRNHRVFDHFDTGSIVFEDDCRRCLGKTKFIKKSPNPKNFFGTESSCAVFGLGS